MQSQHNKLNCVFSQEKGCGDQNVNHSAFFAIIQNIKYSGINITQHVCCGLKLPISDERNNLPPKNTDIYYVLALNGEVISSPQINCNYCNLSQNPSKISCNCGWSYSKIQNWKAKHFNRDLADSKRYISFRNCYYS